MTTVYGRCNGASLLPTYNVADKFSEIIYFMFIQDLWVNFTKCLTLYHTVDPILQYVTCQKIFLEYRLN